MDKALNLASLAMLDYPCAKLPYLDALNKPCCWTDAKIHL